MRKALLLILALALAVTTVMALAEGTSETDGPTTPPAVTTSEPTVGTSETPEGPTEEPGTTDTTEPGEPTEPEDTATTEPEDTATAEPEETATAEPTATDEATTEPTADATEEPTAEPSEEPTEEATPEPVSTPTVDPNAVPMGDMGQMGPQAVSPRASNIASDYEITYPTLVTLDSETAKGTLRLHLKFKKDEEADLQVYALRIKVISNNPASDGCDRYLSSKEGHDLRYYLTNYNSKDTFNWRCDNFETMERDVDIAVEVDELEDLTIDGEYTDRLTFTVLEALTEKINEGDPGYPEEPGIEESTPVLNDQGGD